jgi:AcrR family transcriptional regulator
MCQEMWLHVVVVLIERARLHRNARRALGRGEHQGNAREQGRLMVHAGTRPARRPGARRAPSALHAQPRIPARHGLPAAHVAELQRSRLLAAALAAVEEHGYTGTSVARITDRARVSRRTFYEQFANTEACLAALIEDVIALLARELAAADLDTLPWRERVRGGLAVILAFFDREPALARVCVVQALRAGPPVLERRAELLARLARVVDEGRKQGSRAVDCTPLTAEGLVGAAFAIVYTRVLRGERKPLLGLLGQLTAMVVLPYLGPAAARREQARPAPKASTLARGRPQAPAAAQPDPLQGLQMRMTYRTARVLECIAGQPGVSNRAVADYAGIADQGQVSKLLARLQRLGLAANNGDGHTKGEANAWHLTELGERVAQRLNVGAGRNQEER